MSKRKAHEVAVEIGTGNVYADLGYPDADAMRIKAQLVTKIAEIIGRKGITQTQAAKLLEMSQPEAFQSARAASFVAFSERRPDGLPDEAWPRRTDRGEGRAALPGERSPFRSCSALQRHGGRILRARVRLRCTAGATRSAARGAGGESSRKSTYQIWYVGRDTTTPA